MRINLGWISWGVLFSTLTVAAQTVTAPSPGGTANSVPVFTGAATLGNSAITEAGSSPNGKVGINTSTPAKALDVESSDPNSLRSSATPAQAGFQRRTFLTRPTPNKGGLAGPMPPLPSGLVLSISEPKMRFLWSLRQITLSAC